MYTVRIMKKILILLGHTDTSSYTAQLANAYEEAARGAGHEVTRMNIGDLHFDPILHMGYKEIQALEPDLEMLQKRIKEADHLVILYPNWWSSMPAILKGLFDRVWLPGFAFNFDKNTHKVIQHLRGKTARVIVVSGTMSPLAAWWKYGDYTNEIRHAILEFAGVKTAVSVFGPCERTTKTCRVNWIKNVESLGMRGI